jgi:hypothetical protein
MGKEQRQWYRLTSGDNEVDEWHKGPFLQASARGGGVGGGRHTVRQRRGWGLTRVLQKGQVPMGCDDILARLRDADACPRAAVWARVVEGDAMVSTRQRALV